MTYAHTLERVALTRAFESCDSKHEERALTPSSSLTTPPVAAAWCVCHRTGCPVDRLVSHLVSPGLSPARHLATDPGASRLRVGHWAPDGPRNESKGFRANAIAPLLCHLSSTRVAASMKRWNWSCPPFRSKPPRPPSFAAPRRVTLSERPGCFSPLRNRGMPVRLLVRTHPDRPTAYAAPWGIAHGRRRLLVPLLMPRPDEPSSLRRVDRSR
jgi:hypothetical protein